MSKNNNNKKKNSQKKQNNRNMGILILLLLVVTISVGYAALSSVLNINGSSKVSGNETWDVHFTNISENPTKVGFATDEGTGLYQARINSSNNKLVEFAISMRQPKDSYSFNVDVKNFGTLPAKVSLTVDGLDDTAKDYLTWTVTGIGENETLASQASKTLTITVYYKDIDSLPTEEFTANLTAHVDAVQS
jgi:hypothetical protein